tara:strand:- start:653 stop:1069 length:417 start_codon:yes stop_codon:yes gene_type:complete
MSLEQKKIFKFYVGYDDIFNEIENLSNIKSQTNIAFDVLKYDNSNYEINIALAGITKDQITIEQLNNFLMLEVKEKVKPSFEGIIHKGIINNSIKQAFRLEQSLEVDEAELFNGILKIKLHKKEMKAKLKREIEIIEE